MQNVASEYDLFKKSAFNSAKIIHEKHSWSSIADMIIERLQEFEKKNYT
jgi:hypothetical protein